MYVPILKEKQGEKDALLHLSDYAKEKICPLLEIAPEHFLDPCPSNIENSWQNKPYYLDFPYEKISEGIDDSVFKDWVIKNTSKYMIPVIHLSYKDTIIKQIFKIKDTKVAIRFTIDEFFEEDFIDDLLKIMSTVEISNVDLIVDSQDINASNYKKQAASVKACLKSIPNINEFNSIIIASGSFPQTLDIEKEQFLTTGKHELDLYTLVKKEFKDSNLIYSDYSINHWTSFEFIPGMQPSYNIRYTLKDNYLVFKGKTIKKGGLDIANIRQCCIDLVASSYFFGPEFSWGDNVIQEISDKTRKTGGNLTTWRAIGTNHHIELIIKQLSNLDDI